MPFLDPTAEFDPEVSAYRPALERFSRWLDGGEPGGMPPPGGKLGPIRSVMVSRALRDDDAEVLGQVKDHAIFLLKGNPHQEPELRYNFNLLLLMDVFGLREDECDRYEPELNKLLW